MSGLESIEVPDNLENTVLEQFDVLVDNGDIFWEPSVAEHVLHRDFKVCRTFIANRATDTAMPLFLHAEFYLNVADNGASSNFESCHPWIESQCHHPILRTERREVGRSWTLERKRSS